MAIETFNFLTEDGVLKLATDILTKVNSRIAERIVAAVDETSNDKHVASAKALYDLKVALEGADAALSGRLDTAEETLGTHGESIVALEEAKDDHEGRIAATEGGLSTLEQTVAALTHLTIETVVGDITTVVTEPKSDVLYFQKDKEDDPTWMLYIYQAPAVEGEQGTWVNVGDTEIDMTQYYAKSEVEQMKIDLGMHDAAPIEDTVVGEKVDAAATATEPDLT